MTKLFVGNLSFQTTQDDLTSVFAPYGVVEKIDLVTDRMTGNPRGFAFVEMTNLSEAENAISVLNGSDLHGRTLNINKARPKTESGYSSGARGSGFKKSRW
jgi:RNA recognition motif-containing protein